MPRVTKSDEVFKKREQVVDRPQTTDHNINDEYFRHPPHNVDIRPEVHSHPTKTSAKNPTDDEREPTPPEEVGRRITPLEEMARATEEGSVLPDQ